MPTMFDPACHQRTVGRLRSLTPDTPARWGTMNAPRMIAHLTDQMTHTLGDVPVKLMPGPMRLPFARHAIIYWLPWPRGRVKGPPEAFVTKPANWDADLKRLEGLVQRLVDRGPSGQWPEHAKFGKMSGKDWGAFCAKHFDHHLRQFGC